MVLTAPICFAGSEGLTISRAFSFNGMVRLSPPKPGHVLHEWHQKEMMTYSKCMVLTIHPPGP
jgi:hypothetical protein